MRATIFDRIIFVNKGRLSEGATLRGLTEHAAFREYLGKLVDCVNPAG